MPELPKYIQARIDSNNLRITELKKLCLEDDSLELFEEIVFLKKENQTLSQEVPLISIVEEGKEKKEIIFEIKPEDTVRNIKSDDGLDLGDYDHEKRRTEIIDVKYEERDKKASEEFGEWLYKIENRKQNEYIELDDMELFKKYNISFINGLPVNIDLDHTPPFVIERIRQLRMADRLKPTGGRSFIETDVFGSDSYEIIYYETQLSPEFLKTIKHYDPTIEDKITVKELESNEYVLLQLKPDLRISTDYRYTLIQKPKDFDDLYKKQVEKSKEFKYPIYVARDEEEIKKIKNSKKL